MKTKVLSLLFVAIAGSGILHLNAQQKKYDFEDQGAAWLAEKQSSWAISDAASLSGRMSLGYTVSSEGEYSVSPITVIDTESHTIMKVREADRSGGEPMIIASDYDGVVLGIDYSGAILWKSNTGNGTMNHDLWCDDITGDGADEILVANANGSLYCFDINGDKLWEFKPYESYHLTPMYAVTVVRDDQLTPYVVCGAFDMNIYYLDDKGTLQRTVESKSYSKIKGWGDDKPENFVSNANFLRPLPLEDGSDLLVMHASNNHMQSSGHIYLFKPLAETTHHEITDLDTNLPGELRVVDPDGDGVYEILYGSSTLNGHVYNRVEFSDNNYNSSVVHRNDISRKNTGVTSYRVNQPFVLPNSDGGYNYFVLSSNQLLIYPETAGDVVSDQLSTTFAYNDVWPLDDGCFLMAGTQDGGSCVYIVDTQKKNWKKAFKNLIPKGKMAVIMENARKVRQKLEVFSKPSFQREPVKVTGIEGNDLPVFSRLSDSQSLALFEYTWHNGKVQETSWRSPLYDGNIFQDKRDRRNDYVRTENDVVDFFTSGFENNLGVSMWGGHGNDPLYYSLSVLKGIASYGYENGKKPTIYVFPEMNHHGEDFTFVMENHIYPLMNHLEQLDGNIVFRAKDTFWQGHVYTDTWKHIVSGEYAGVAIPALEETTDKTQDLSLLGRMGLWASGAVDGWAVRCSRDDPSFDRSRQFSSQKLSNHILKKTLYSIACGAKYIHNHYNDTENPVFEYHSSLVLELIEKEALYVPEPDEILSFSPVHLSIINPQDSYLNEASNNKWTTFYDREKEEANPAVFSHMNGSWPGAALTPWDFSTYASGVVDRRQNTIPPYPNGKVLITPVQEGAFADDDAVRGKLVDHLHPIYKNIMKEYITDGVDYISADGNTRYKADTYYKQIEKDIKEGAKKLPLSVSGDRVGWVVAQMSSTHLRLTLVDGGYLNPGNREVTVTFNTVSPVKIQDVLDHEVFDHRNLSSVKIDVPCGMFRFIDIEISEPL